MKCPFCGDQESKVVDSRPADEGSSIRRRRECIQCNKRFTTYEIMERLPLVVIKRDGTRQTFERAKAEKAIRHACGKRPVSDEQIRTMIDQRVDNISGGGSNVIVTQDPTTLDLTIVDA